MKKYFIILYILFVGCIQHTIAQNVTTGPIISSWLNVSIPGVSASVKAPSAPVLTDTLNTQFYSIPVDSVLGLTITSYDSAYFATDDTIINNALAQQNGDTLRAMASLILVASNTTLSEINNITINGNKGLEIGIQYQALGTDVAMVSYMEFFIVNHHFICFTITGSQNDATRLTAYKNSFFASIQFSISS